MSMKLCEECGKNEATVLIALVVNGRNTHKHLCMACMTSMKAKFINGNIQSLLSSILSSIAAAGEEETMAVCTRCGLNYRDFKESGKLGCAQCYNDFSELLKPIILRIHGRSQHSGRIPSTAQQDRKRADAMTQLRARLEQAIVEENFEEAAEVRDRLKEMAKEGENAT
jgi:protein arginine kinase activator